MLLLFLFIFFFLPLHHFRIFSFVSDTYFSEGYFFPFSHFMAHDTRPVSLGKNVGNEGSHHFFFFFSLSVKFYEKNFCPLCKPIPTEWPLFNFLFVYKVPEIYSTLIFFFFFFSSSVYFSYIQRVGTFWLKFTYGSLVSFFTFSPSFSSSTSWSRGSCSTSVTF